MCGLNPHAGEDGYLGREEIETINPVLESYRAQGFKMSLSLPADTLFTPEHLKMQMLYLPCTMIKVYLC